MPTSLDRRLIEQLADQERRGLTRFPPPISKRQGVRYHLDDHPVVGFCSNDYLGLANHPYLAEPLSAPTGATASRLVCGDLPEHRSLEARLADLAGSEDAVLFPSGFQLNVSVLGALLLPSEKIHSDALNHASLIDGLRLSRANIEILPHGSPPSSPGWWVTEALFSMDGDFADSSSLRTYLAADGYLYLDEAHSFGLFTHQGRVTGYAGAHQIRPTVLVATLGKSFGCSGAFLAASAIVCRWIRGSARSFVYSTGTSPLLTAQLNRAIDLVSGPLGQTQRQRLWENVEHLAARLQMPSRSPIFSIVLGSNDRALTLSAFLLERGWHVQAIRPPTVPDGTSRLRITVTAGHTPAQIDAFADDLRELL